MKKSLLIITVMSLFMLFLAGTAGALTSLNPLSPIIDTSLTPDWELDYFRAIEPGELKTGEYRLTTAYGRVNSEIDNDSFYGNVDMDPWGMLLNFDTAFEKDIYFNMSYTYVPEYKDYDEDKNKGNSYNLTLTHVTKNNNRIFFGYSDSKTETRNYLSSTEEYEQSEKNKDQTLYIGAEIRGSFPFVK